MPRTRPLSLVVGLALAAAAVLVSAPAFAHVTVNPGTAQQGSYAKLTFRVPNEQDDASTTRLRVYFPADAPLAGVSVRPVPGWTATVTRTRLPEPVHTQDGTLTQAVSRITWRADSAASAIRPGQFQEFDISAGPLPRASRMVFKALQTYSDGQVVRWIQVPGATGPEPEHPAPVLTLVRSAGSGAGSAGAPPEGHGSDAGARADWALGLAIAALVAALAGLGLRLRRP